jgi:hypothetical protein
LFRFCYYPPKLLPFERPYGVLRQKLRYILTVENMMSSQEQIIQGISAVPGAGAGGAAEAAVEDATDPNGFARQQFEKQFVPAP